MNILHLSDIHFGRNYERTGIKDNFVNRNKIMDELLECIKNMDDKEKPEHIIVTGDIAWWGMKDEFEEAKKWFKRLLEVTELTGKNLSFCVGNHDVNINYGKDIGEITDEKISVIDTAYEFQNIFEYESTIQEYEKFCEELEVEPYRFFIEGEAEYSYSVGYKDVTFPSESIIRFFSFNTSMLFFGRNIKEDKMWIGKPQIESLLEYGVMPKTQLCTYSIALMHHAERYLHPNEISEYNGRTATLPLLMNNVDLVLCGHTETGGKPVLKEQADGGKILTAGATYFNDDHPNSFSLINVPDYGETIVTQLFMYKEGWYEYKKNAAAPIVKEKKELTLIGDTEEKCEFVVIADEEEYKIALNRVSVYFAEQQGVNYCKLDNKKDVIRNLDVRCEGSVSGGTATAKVTIASKKKNDVSAMLEREKYFYFLSKKVSSAKETHFYIRSESGNVILQGTKIKIEETQVNEKGIDILEKLLQIERAYNIRFVRPDDVYELDDFKIDMLIEIIEKGYTEKVQIKSQIDFNMESLDEMHSLYKKACVQNRFKVIQQGDYVCNIFGCKIKMENYIIISESYEVNMDDMREKIETYREGDIRKVNLQLIGNNHTYFIADGESYKKIYSLNDCEAIAFAHLNIDNGFIMEAKEE